MRKVITGKGIPFVDKHGQKKWQVPPGYGDYSGKIIGCSTFEYEAMVDESQDDVYRFSEDDEFMCKLKAMYSRHSMRRSGRTQLLARIAVEIAIETGESVNFLDHHSVFKHSGNRAQSDFMRRIREIIYEYNEKGCEIDVVDFTDSSFRLHCRNTFNYRNVRITDLEGSYLNVGKQHAEKVVDDELLLICDV